MSGISSIIDRAEQTCSAHGTRLTDKRKQILSELLKSSCALSAYELADRYRTTNNETIPTMSVYRILEFLESENLVHKLRLANKYVACSHIACNHTHQVPQFLICDRCGKVKEIGIQKSLIDALKDTVDEAGYRLTNYQLELPCLCAECSASGD